VSHVVERVAAGIYQIRLPLPFPLRIVNCYLLEDDGGWTVVDAGLNYPPGREAWQTAFAALDLDPASIRRVILTHAHPDHYGMAGWLANHSDAPVFCSPLERAFAERAWQNDSTSEDDITALFRIHGMPAELGVTVAEDIRALRQLTQPPPASMTDLDAGMGLQIGGRQFEAIITPGHSDGHLVFYCADERLLLCGDAVLAKITPNVGIWGWSGPNPLADFLHSLDRLAELPIDLALPGHKTVITRFAERLAELRHHHHERLALMETEATGGKDAYTICTRVFPVEELTSHQVRFAMAETLAHLEYLVSIGRLERVEQDGVRFVPSDSLRSG
jgi:glyoxylase-like metal-dependent hydrolase (beta-lactamase superfamily II)